MPAIVLVGHDHLCPSCGPTTVNSGATSFKVNGRAVARVGDTLTCGATITSGSPSMSVEGQPVARVGDVTDHNGTLENGDSSWMVD
ncbi:PAAR motif protein [compost metagenome]